MEMVSRSVKRVLWAAMALVRTQGSSAIASAIACVLNAFLGSEDNKLRPLLREWVTLYTQVITCIAIR